jgi:antitoxin HigA-1
MNNGSTFTGSSTQIRPYNGGLRDHPSGEILKAEFLDPLGISQYRIARAIDVPPRRINEIAHGKRGISADTALRLSRALGLSDMFWINMQAHYDAEIAREHIGSELATIERIA